MPTYRKRPVEVQAFQWFLEGDPQGAPIGSEITPTGREVWFLKTLEGDLRIRPGYWIVKGTHEGEWWAIRPDIFEETYEHIIQEDECDCTFCREGDGCDICQALEHFLRI